MFINQKLRKQKVKKIMKVTKKKPQDKNSLNFQNSFQFDKIFWSTKRSWIQIVFMNFIWGKLTGKRLVFAYIYMLTLCWCGCRCEGPHGSPSYIRLLSALLQSGLEISAHILSSSSSSLRGLRERPQKLQARRPLILPGSSWLGFRSSITRYKVRRSLHLII